MRVKELFKLFVPPIVFVLRRKIIRCFIVQRISPIPTIRHNAERMVVIGNGPSLNESLEKYFNEINACDKIVVNYMGLTPYFDLLKPGVYVFADPIFFSIPEQYKEKILGLYKNIVEKTTWSMQVIIPSSARGAIIEEILSQNENIMIGYYYNETQDVGKMSKFEAWDRNLVEPPAQTVLNTCVYLSLYWNYKETYLIGADTSFLEDLKIDQNTNEILLADNHFYQKDKGLGEDFSVVSGWDLHDLILSYSTMFRMYSELKEYADYKGLKVYNASEYSWINVFERKKIG